MRLLMSASALALCVALGAPAQAQQPTPAPTPTPGVMAPTQLDANRLSQKLQQVGVEERQEFQGRLLRAQTSEGHPFLLILGPENMAGGETIDVQMDQITEPFRQAGFQQIEPIEDVTAVRGKLDDDKTVLALAGERGWAGRTTRPGVSPIDREQLKEKLGEADIEERTEFEGKLFRARTAEGHSFYMLIGPEEMAGDESVDVDTDQIRQRMQQAGFQDVQMVEQDIAMVRGKLNDHAALALGGAFIEPAPVGPGVGGAPVPGPGQPGQPRQQ